MKAVGNEPACTLRRAGDGRAAPIPGTHKSAPNTPNQLAGHPSEPTPLTQTNETPPLDFGPIGWWIEA